MWLLLAAYGINRTGCVARMARFGTALSAVVAAYYRVRTLCADAVPAGGVANPLISYYLVLLVMAAATACP